MAKLKFKPISIGGSNSSTTQRDSRILSEFPKDALDDLYSICTDYDEPDNNVRSDRVNYLCSKLGFKELGPGTNRIAFLKDGNVFKIALDRRGLIDNLSEYKRSIETPAALSKSYETNRTILTCEYCSLMDVDQYQGQKDQLRKILELLSTKYIMDDLGLTPKNYCNWGYRANGALVAIDYAYLYPYEKYPDVLRCSCGGLIESNSSYTGYKCSKSSCGNVYTPTELLQRFPMDFEDDETEEIYKNYFNHTNRDMIILDSNGEVLTTVSQPEYDNTDNMVDDTKEEFTEEVKVNNSTNSVEPVKAVNGVATSLSDHLQDIVHGAKFEKPPSLIDGTEIMDDLPQSALDQNCDVDSMFDMLEKYKVLRANDPHAHSNPIYDD